MTLEILTFKYSIVFISDTIVCPSCHLSFNLPVINQNLSIYLHRVLKSRHAPKHLQEVRAEKCTDIYTPLHGRLYWCTHNTTVTTIQTTTIIMKINYNTYQAHTLENVASRAITCLLPNNVLDHRPEFKSIILCTSYNHWSLTILTQAALPCSLIYMSHTSHLTLPTSGNVAMEENNYVQRNQLNNKHGCT